MTIGKTIYQTLHNLRNLHIELTYHASDHHQQDIKRLFSNYAHQLNQMEQYLTTWIQQKEMDQYVQSELLYNNVLIQDLTGQ